MKATTVAKCESFFRPLLMLLPAKVAVKLYSRGRIDFLRRLEKSVPLLSYDPPNEMARTLWDMRFRSPLMNAAGMFKNGECVFQVFMQGAAGYLGGTGTWNSRYGNGKKGIYLPFVPYPLSHSASNWLGLPNNGDELTSEIAKANLQIDNHMPVGWSVMSSPDYQGQEKLQYLIMSMKVYEEARVDFLEINESCPNTEQGLLQDDDLANRLRFIKEQFLDQRSKRLPVVVKFSNDTEIGQVPALLDLLFRLGFDGVNFGNTSTAYDVMRAKIHPAERRVFDYFYRTFGGGVSGRPLKEISLGLCAKAVEYLKAGPPTQEFHVIRTGGVESWQDVQESERAGVSLNQWFTGYFENFAKHGHGVYKKLFEPY